MGISIARLPPGVRVSGRLLGGRALAGDHAERGRPVDVPPSDPLTIITPHRILYTEHWLRKSGFSPRQTWRVE